MVKLLKWLFFLSKRLYKKWTFLLLIGMIPVSVAALAVTSVQNKGFVQIAVVNLAEDMGDQIIEQLNSGEGIINAIEYRDEAQARKDLQADKLDAVWVLPENMAHRIAAFVHNPEEDNYIVQVIRKEESLKTRLALEKLSGAIYPFTSRLFFLQCVREDPDFDLSYLTDDEIYAYYDNFFSAENFFRFSFPDNSTDVKQNEQDYMTSPIRGVLSAVTLLAGLSAAMLFISDEKKGVFSYLKNSSRVFVSFAFQLTAILNVGFFAFLSMFVLGVNTFFWRELVIFFIYAVNAALFCTVLQQLVSRMIYFAPVMVLISVLDLLICPIFFDYTVQRKLQYVFPNTYYINSVHSYAYLEYSLLYMGAAALILFLAYLYKRKA